MNKLQEYLKKKRIKELGLPKIYVVKSTPDGVDPIQEKQVIEITQGIRLPIDKYEMEDYPYTIDILRGESSARDEGHGTGIGDLWAWTYFYSLSKEEAEAYYQKEKERVETKYGQQFQNTNLSNPLSDLKTLLQKRLEKIQNDEPYDDFDKGVKFGREDMLEEIIKIIDKN